MDRSYEFLQIFSIRAENHIPRPVGEYAFHPLRKWRFDAAWPDLWIAVEIEGVVRSGKGRHQNHVTYGADCEKYNAAVLMGWKVLRYTTHQLRDHPVQIVEEVIELIEDDQQSQFAIDRGVELPEITRGRKPCRFPWPTLQVGDSFAVDVPAGKAAGTVQSNMASLATKWRNKNDPSRKFSTRVVDDGTRVRVWRVE